MYFRDIDKTVLTFMEYEKGDPLQKKLLEAETYKKKYMRTKTIMAEINEAGMYKGYGLFPFGENPYTDLDEMVKKIKEYCLEDGKKYIYAYDDEPDHIMHMLGTVCKEAKDMIRYRNIICEKLSSEIEDAVIFIIADHGHVPIENILLSDYPEIIDCLLRNTSIEPRATTFFIKPDKIDVFQQLFREKFSTDFDLYTKAEIINSKIFGDGDENPIFRDSLGDFLAIAKGNKAFIYNGDEKLVSHHAGYTEDEILVPLIII